MQIKRNSTAHWNGTGKDGAGTLSSQSGVLQNTKYDSPSRFESGTNTNPEELIAAAHAGCFSMKLAYNLAGAGFENIDIQTGCEIVFEAGSVIESNLSVNAKVADISNEKFDELIQHAKDNCPISKLLNAKISLSYTLNQ